MSILKVEFSVPDLRKAVAAFTENRLKAFDGLVSDFREVVSTPVNQLLNAELDLFLGEPSQSDNKKNGFKERDYVLGKKEKESLAAEEIKAKLMGPEDFES
jgi:transposase-like protein